MKRLILLATITTLLGLLLAACGTAAPAATVAPTQTDEANVVVYRSPT
ncbi:MAG: hypothetical protein J5I90_03310 [Caldilineales bacterium]|nr:hypothetical protein [Caldilineales bacterium]